LDHAWGYATDRRLRERNEDSLGAFELPTCTLIIVCDGMGGHAGGDQASAIAVRVIHDTMRDNENLPIEQALSESIQAANRAIYEVSRKVRRLLGMGTTVAVIAVRGPQAWVGHVGDSRIYMIRGNRTKLLTRDHTMVNLFVDAELLSPEDAQSHPEAHILARSVGVDRHVDVDVDGPHDLRSGDILFACSDGVHGSVEDGEFAEADWTSPQTGVEQILKVVRAREGDDNATLAAIGIDFPTLENPPPSMLPAPEVLASIGMDSGRSALTQGVATPVPQAPRPAIRMTTMGGGAFVLDAGTQVRDNEAITFTPSNKRPQTPQLGVPTPHIGPDTPQDTPAEPLVPQRLRMSLLIGAAAGAACLVLAGAWLASRRASDPNAPVEQTAANVQVLGIPDQQPGVVALPEEAMTAVPEALALPEDIDTAAENPMVLPEAWRYAPMMPRRNRRVPHRPTRYVEPPPGGEMQLEAVLAARNRECPESLNAVMSGMKVSTDFAALYAEAWDCFSDNHQSYLARQDVRSLDDFADLVVHFQGYAATEPGSQDVPSWSLPARGGIEYRIDALLNSTDDDRFADVMVDRLGGPALAESFVRDATLEIGAAAALSRVDDPSPVVQAWWARRAYYGARLLSGLPGELIAQYRPDLRAKLIAELDTASGGTYSDPDLVVEGVPEGVQTAMQVAAGTKSAPAVAPAPRRPRPTTATPRPTTVPTPEPEPDTDAPVDPNARPIVHRGGENPMPEDLRQQ
jgi:serine/threonine protein phosphatase PrpC